MPKATLQLKTQYRSATFERTAVNEEARTVELSFCSEEPVERYFGREILDCSPQSVDLSRLSNGGALLVNHDTDDQVGVVESARIDADRKGRAIVRFGNSARAQEIFDDVKSGIRRLVSVGYAINQLVIESVNEGVETLRATRWEPLEISLVPVPADATVGVGRASESITQATVEDPMKLRNFRKFNDPDTGGNASTGTAASQVTVEQEVERRLTAEQSRRDNINAIAARASGMGKDLSGAAREFIEGRKSVDEFQRFAFEQISNATPVSTDPNIGMSNKDKRAYSLVRAMSQIANQKPLDGLERECSDAMAKKVGRDAQGFFIPHDLAEAEPDQRLLRALHRQGALRRDLSASVPSGGGYTVQTDVLGGSLIELLRNRIAVRELGATTLSGLMGNVAIPAQNGGASAYWLPENSDVNLSAQQIGQLALTPRRLAGATAFSKSLLVQSSIDIEAFVRTDLARIMAIEFDRAAINGKGANGEPMGILNTTGVGTVTFSSGGAPTWKELLKFKTKLAQANADFGSLAYLSTPAVEENLKSTPKASSYPVFLMSDTNTINGYQTEITNQVPNDKIIFGNWSDLILADWAGMDVTVDPFTLAGYNQVRIIVNMLADVGLRHPQSFAYSTNAGA